MGCSVVASCPCGYQSSLLMIGGGMMDFTYSCAFPAYCSEGKHLVTVNMFDKPRRCPDGHLKASIPYNDASLINVPGTIEVTSWKYSDHEPEAQLTDGLYFCPICHAFSLTFIDGGLLWD